MSKSNDTVQAILLDLGIERGRIREESRLKGDLELDSTDLVQVALELKRQLGVEMQFDSRDDLTLAQLCADVDARLAS